MEGSRLAYPSPNTNSVRAAASTSAPGTESDDDLSDAGAALWALLPSFISLGVIWWLELPSMLAMLTVVFVWAAASIILFVGANSSWFLHSLIRSLLPTTQPEETHVLVERNSELHPHRFFISWERVTTPPQERWVAVADLLLFLLTLATVSVSSLSIIYGALLIHRDDGLSHAGEVLLKAAVVGVISLNYLALVWCCEELFPVLDRGAAHILGDSAIQSTEAFWMTPAEAAEADGNISNLLKAPWHFVFFAVRAFRAVSSSTLWGFSIGERIVTSGCTFIGIVLILEVDYSAIMSYFGHYAPLSLLLLSPDFPDPWPLPTSCAISSCCKAQQYGESSATRTRYLLVCALDCSRQMHFMVIRILKRVCLFTACGVALVDLTLLSFCVVQVWTKVVIPSQLIYILEALR